MQNGGLVQLTYWGGWASALLAVLYKALFSFGVFTTGFYLYPMLPRHLWQMSFLLFLICVATAVRTKSA